MKKIAVLAVLTVMMAFSVQAGSRANFSIAFTGGDDAQNSYYIALGDYNRMQQGSVILIRQQGISDEDLPVVLFLASKAGVPYQEVINLRLKGWKWMRITRHYRLEPSIFYVRVNGAVSGGHYGNPYRNFNGRPQNKWSKIRLSDAEVVNMVNLRFFSEYYGYDPDEVIKMRDGGRNFVVINNDIRAERMKMGRSSKKNYGR